MSENTERKRNVTFPDDDGQLITATYGPEDPWHKDEQITAELLIARYQESCFNHGVESLPKLIQQLQSFDYQSDDDDDDLPSLDLSGCVLDFLTCETLEEILKRLRFDTINLADTQISEEGAVALFEMVEYYEACQTLNISRNENILARGWQACSRMIKKTQCLRALIAKSTCLKEEFIPFLTRTLKIGTHLTVLNLERCRLNGRPITMLANALRMNRSLQEIYLGENNLESMDAYNLSNLLTHNSNLQLLDLSNNQIGDKGAQHLCLCLAEKLQTLQQPRSPQSPIDSHDGLAVLVLWNNCLTHLSGQHFAKLLEKYNELEILNVGHNNLTDSWLRGVREPLKHNHGLYTLGLQSTRLTSAAATDLASVFEHNTTLVRVDLRENQVGVEGLKDLRQSLESNKQLEQLDLDQNPTYLEKEEEKIRYQDLYQGIATKLEANIVRTSPITTTTATPKPASRLTENPRLTSRKISLTCEIKIPPPQTMAPKKSLTSGRLRSPAPSPTPSPVLSPIPSPGKSRFSVSKVPDPHLPLSSPHSTITTRIPEIKSSRFSITPVKDIPKIVLPEENKVTVGFQVSDGNDSNIFKFDSDSVKESVDTEIKTKIVFKNDENFNFDVDNTECDSEVEGIMKDGKQEDSPTNEERVVVEITPAKDHNNKHLSEKLETITEMNPAFIDSSNDSPTKPLHGILSKRSKFASTYPPRLDSYEPLRETKHLSENSQISRTEPKSTLQNLFALFQNPSISFSSTASAFYAKTEAKMSQIVPSFSSITLNYEPFKFHSTSSHKSTISSKLDKHMDSVEVKREKHLVKSTAVDSSSSSSSSSTTAKQFEHFKSVGSEDSHEKNVSSDTENSSKYLIFGTAAGENVGVDLKSGKKKKAKKKNVKKEEPFWDFGDDTTTSSSSTVQTIPNASD